MSVMTFANGPEAHLNFRNASYRGSDTNIFGNTKMGTVGSNMENGNSWDTHGARSKAAVDGNDSNNVLDTEPGEINDETTACGCPHNKIAEGMRTSCIPAQNI